MNRLLAIHQSNFSSNGSFDHLIVCVVFHCYSPNVIFTTSRFNMNSSYSHSYGMFTLVCVMCGWATIHSTFSRFAFRRIQIDFDSLAVFVCHGSVMFYVCCSVAYIPPHHSYLICKAFSSFNSVLKMRISIHLGIFSNFHNKLNEKEHPRQIAII